MTHREELEEQYEDAFFALLMDEIAEEEGQTLLKENERLKQDLNSEVPEELDQKCHKIIADAIRREQGKAYGRASLSILKRTAVIIILAAMLFTVAYAAIPVFQTAVNNLILEFEQTDRSTDFVLQPGKSGPGDNSARYDSVIYSYSIPEAVEGYTFIDDERYSYNALKSRHYRFESPDGNYYIIEVRIAEGAVLSVDSEDTQNAKDITVNGCAGYCVVKGEEIQAAWADTDRNVFFIITASDLTEDQVMEMAEGIKFDGDMG